jgi:hypothetical protein
MKKGVNKTQNIAAGELTYTTPDGIIHSEIASFVSEGDNAHAEVQVINWARDKFKELGPISDPSLILVTQYFPCKNGPNCWQAYQSGAWNNILDQAAGQPVDIDIWWYRDTGELKQLHKQS